MPKLLIIRSFLFVIYSADIAEKRRHIHVESKKSRFRVSAKWWLEPDIELVNPGNYSLKEINEIEQLINENKELLQNQIDLFLKGEKVTPIKLL
jgi:hypothetical protein